VQDAIPYAYLRERGLPVELRQDIVTQCMGSSNNRLTEDEAAQFRAETAWERTRMMAEVNGSIGNITGSMSTMEVNPSNKASAS